MPISLRSALCLLALLAAIAPAAQAQYSIIDLGVLGGYDSKGLSVNNNGQVSGNSTTATINPSIHAFRWDSTNGMTDLGTLGGSQSFSYGINSLGQVTGEAGLRNGETHAFLWKEGGTDGPAGNPQMKDLGTLGGGFSGGDGVNNKGEVTGYAATYANAAQRAFLWDSTHGMRDLGTLGGNNSFGQGINNSTHTQVTGVSYLSGNNNYHAFLWTEGATDGLTSNPRMKDLGTLQGGTLSAGFGVNDSGQVAGWSRVVGNVATHAFLYDVAKGMQDLKTLGGANSQAYGLNNAGEVVGFSSLSNNVTYHAFIYDVANGMRDLNDLLAPGSGWVLREARDINDAGQITGYGTIGGQTHAFLLSRSQSAPVPEAGTLASFGSLAGLGGVGMLLRRRRAPRPCAR